MAGSVLISLSSKILSTIASPAFDKAYEKGVSIWEAKDELHKLQVTIETLQAVVIDAEKRQEGSAAVKNWVQRLKGVLYDAEDLFDEFATEDLLKQQMLEGKNKLPLKNKVRVYCSKLNPIVSRNSIAKKVKAIRERLFDISIDMAHFGFVPNHAIELEHVLNMRGERYAARCSPDAKYVVGRDEDKKVILEMLFNESSDTPVVIVIEGIGGMGKTTLAHLIYNDEKVSTVFEKRWFACISNTTDEREVFGKIYQSVSGSGYSDLTMFQLQEKVREFITGKKYLLVLDDVWEDHHGRWVNRLSLLSSGAKGSRIVVTTRLPSVGIAMGAVKAHSLGGLTNIDSWDLFKSLSFASVYENDPRREIVGKNLLKRCRGVPLAIWCMGSLLHNKTIQEWEEIERVDFPTLGGQYNDEIMSILKLSYDHLSSNLKHCFVYCCLFPKDYGYKKEELIYHWIAQGYIIGDEGESSFMHLSRMGFFQDVQKNIFGEVESCKMHDLIHDLALYLGGEETIMLGIASSSTSSCTRHVRLSVDAYKGGLKEIPTSLFSVKALRSCLLGRSQNLYSSPHLNLNQLCVSFKLLRTLTLFNLEIEDIPPSIGELKLVRYLDLAGNKFEKLPDSITNLVNLLVLDISWCQNLKVWPHNFKKLIKLWTLNFMACAELRLMPEGFGEIACLQYLSNFKVEKVSEIGVLNGLLKQLRGHLSVTFCEEIEVQDGLNLELPAGLALQHLDISLYPGQRIRGWGNNNCSSKLQQLQLRNCKNVKYLPHFNCLPILKSLMLDSFGELEFMEEEEEREAIAASNKLFFPCLEKLTLLKLPKLKGWRRGKVAAESTSSSTSKASAFMEFSHFSELHVRDCPNLASFPHCPSLQEFTLEYCYYGSPEITQELSSTSLFSYTYPSLQKLVIRSCFNLGILHLTCPHLRKIKISNCDELKSIELVGLTEPSLQLLSIKYCETLKSLHIAEHLIACLEKIKIIHCPQLRWSKTQDKRLLVQQGVRKVERLELHSDRVDSVLVEQSLLSLSFSSLQSITISHYKGRLSLPGVELTSIRECRIEYTDGLESLHIPSPHFRKALLSHCTGLTSVELESPISIRISNCPELKHLQIAHPDALKRFSFASSPLIVAPVEWDSFPNLGECSFITKLELGGVDGVFILRLLSSPSSSPSPPSSTAPKEISIFKSTGSLTVPFPYLEQLNIWNVPGLKILNLKSYHLSQLAIGTCSQLKIVHIRHPTSVTRLELIDCPELRLTTGVDWDALTNLRCLIVCPLPPQHRLPQCLHRHRQALQLA